MTDAKAHSAYGLENHGLRKPKAVHWNLTQAVLIEHAIYKGEGSLTRFGPLAVNTGQHTGRSANDKFVVRDESTENEIWWGKVNVPYSPEHFDALFARMMDYLEGREWYVQDCFAGADPDRRLPVRIINELAWHSAFARNMFIVGTEEEQASHGRHPFAVSYGFRALPPASQPSGRSASNCLALRWLTKLSGSSRAFRGCAGGLWRPRDGRAVASDAPALGESQPG